MPVSEPVLVFQYGGSGEALGRRKLQEPSEQARKMHFLMEMSNPDYKQWPIHL